jgi:hypothetical protein
MAKLSWFQKIYWKHFSKPVGLRPIVLHLHDHPVASILEIGMGDGSRIRHLLPHYQLKSDTIQLRYAALDAFESADEPKEHLRLKDAHRLFAEHKIKAHLIPGDTESGLMRIAHTVLPSDLVIVDRPFTSSDAESTHIRSWLPRLTHSQTIVFVRSSVTASFEILPSSQYAQSFDAVKRAA